MQLKKISPLLLIVISLFLLSSVTACTSSSLGVAGASGASGEGGTEAGGDSGTASFEAGLPVDIPAPVAKDESGINPSSIQFEPASSGASQDLTNLKTAQSNSTVIGTITGSLVTPAVATIGVIVNGAFITPFLTTDSSGNFTFTVTEQYLGVPISFVVLSRDSTPSNIQDVSYPVTVTLNSIAGQIIMTVTVTNENASSGANIQDDTIATSTSGLVAFSAVTQAGTPFVGDINITMGGSYSTLNSTSIIHNFTSMDFNSATGDLYGLDGTGLTSQIYRITSSGVVSPIGQSFPSASGNYIKVSPDGNWLATKTLNAQNSYYLVLMDLRPANSGNLSGTTQTVITDTLSSYPNNSEPDNSALDFAWVWDTSSGTTPEGLMITKKYSSDNYFLGFLQLFDGNENLVSLPIALTENTDYFTMTDTVSAPVIDATNQMYWFTCPSSRAGINDLCYLGFNFADLTNLDQNNLGQFLIMSPAIDATPNPQFLEGQSVQNIIWVPNTACMIYELVDPTTGNDKNNYIALFDPGAAGQTLPVNTPTLLAKGIKPSVYSNGNGLNIITFLSYDAKGVTLQVNSYNLSQTCTPFTYQ